MYWRIATAMPTNAVPIYLLLSASYTQATFLYTEMWGEMVHATKCNDTPVVQIVWK